MKDKALHAAKSRAGKLLSQYISKIAMEETEFIHDPERGDRMATKAEALARILWKYALGFKEIKQEKINGKLIEREIIHKPSLPHANIIYDRMEGKVSSVATNESNRPTIADKVTKEGVNRINKIGSLKNE